MKKAFLLVVACAAFCVSCVKDPLPDSGLKGKKVNVRAIPESIQKVFVLNEGGMGSNNASLDVLKLTGRGIYVNGAFKKMNPSVAGGLGDVGNDIVVIGDEVWIAVNNSGLVEVIGASDEKEICAIEVPTPRNIAFDGKYAYVSSWSGAYAVGEYDEGGNYNVVNWDNPKGKVYRINLASKKIDGSVEVGYQPEGLAVSGGKLFVANSGGISSQIPPEYAYDNTLSVVDLQSFSVTNTLKIKPNLKNVYADTKGNVYVTSFGNFYDVNSSVYMVDSNLNSTFIREYVSVSAMLGDTLYCIGTPSENEWSNPVHQYGCWKVCGGEVSEFSLPIPTTHFVPYGLCALSDSVFLLADAGDYFNPGSVGLYSDGKKLWSVTAGVCPGHFAIW